MQERSKLNGLGEVSSRSAEEGHRGEKGENGASENKHGLASRSRRNFLKAAAVTVVAVGFGGPTLKNFVQEHASRESLLESINRRKIKIENYYDISVLFDESLIPTQSIESTELWLAQKEHGLAILEQELAKFPPFVIQESSLRKITLRSDLIDVAGKKREGSIMYRIDNEWGGITFLKRNEPRSLILNVGGNLSIGFNVFGWSEGNVRTNFSHELFHALDTMDNNEWAKIQEGKYRYARNDSEYALLSIAAKEQTPGFARFYGRINPLEDKATIFEDISQPESYRALMLRSLKDPILAKKIKALQTYLKNISCGLMDGDYWADVTVGKIDEEYFVKKARRLIAENPATYLSANADVDETGFASWRDKLRREYS